MPATYSAEEVLAALEKSPAFVAIVQGPRYLYEFINERYASIVGIDDPIGKPFGDSHHPAVMALREALDQVYTTGEPWGDPELRLDLRQADGALVTRWFDARFVPLRHGDRIDGVLIHSHDVTALVRAREEAREHAALREKMQQVQKLESLGVLAGGVAHDFNNMLAIVLGNISAAAALVDRDSPAQSLLGAAEDGAVRAAELTRKLLTYAGKSRAKTRSIDLSAQVHDLAHLLAAALPRTITLKLDVTPGLAHVEADPTQIQQVVMNLVINAGEAIGGAPGHVVVSTGIERIEADTASVLAGERMAEGHYAFVDVRDDGPGMDEETLGRIFEPFFSTKAQGPSARGLGLAAVMGIVRGHRGGMRVQTAPGAGTAFHVLLPLSAEARGSTPVRHEGDEWRGTGKVLVVDDDPGVREALAALLELTGFEVLRAADGPSGLERVAASPDLRLVLLDVTMPDMSGAQVLQKLHAMRPRLPVLLVSGNGDARTAGDLDTSTGFLAKPFTLPELVRAVRTALGDA